MSNKGNNRHIKRLASSRYSNVTRKTSKYVVKPYPGRFSSDERIALITVLKEKLGVANTSREAGRIIRSGKVEVNGRRVDTDKFPIGLGDSVSFKDTGESYRVTIGRYGTFSLVKKDDDKIGNVFKVVGKYTERKGRERIRISNGSNLDAGKDVRVNDSVIIDNGNISKVLRLEKGARCLVVRGVHSTAVGEIREIKKGTMLRNPTVEIESNGSTFETKLDNVIVIGS